MKTTPITIGIDFGTCRTSAAIVFGATPQSVPFGKSRSFDFPTAVLVDGTGGSLVGEEAINGTLRNTGHLFTEFKLSVGKRDVQEVDGFRFEYRDLVAAILERVRLTAESQLNNNRPITSARIAVPALYEEGGDSWNSMLEAARAAGFSEVELIREPHAAAIYYDWLQQQGSDSEPADGISLVYDLGGGTFDPAIIERNGDNYAILDAHSSGSEGVRCGGVVFDELIRMDFARKCSGIVQELRLDPTREEDLNSRRRRLRDAAALQEFLQDVKIRLSERGIDEFSEEEPLRGERYRLTRAEFEAMISSLLDQTLESCDRVVVRNGRTWKQVKRILMVGGSCNIPLVRKKLEAHAKKQGASPEICWRRIGTTNKIYDPLLAVSLGAALKGVKADPLALCQEWFAKAEAHRIGLNGQQNLTEAVTWHRKAADAGHPDAQYWMGYFHLHGIVVRKDWNEAFRWFHKGADQGNVQAQHQLGLCYQQGRGIPKNLDQAKLWFQKAVHQGSEDSKNALAQLEREIQPLPAPPPAPSLSRVSEYSEPNTFDGKLLETSSASQSRRVVGVIAVLVVLGLVIWALSSLGSNTELTAAPVAENADNPSAASSSQATGVTGKDISLPDINSSQSQAGDEEIQRQKMQKEKEEQERDAEIQRERDAEIQRERDAEIQRERDAEIQRERDAEIARKRALNAEQNAIKGVYWGNINGVMTLLQVAINDDGSIQAFLPYSNGSDRLTRDAAWNYSNGNGRCQFEKGVGVYLWSRGRLVGVFVKS